MNQELKHIIIEYQNKVSEICDIMLSQLDLVSRDELIEYRITHPSGEFSYNGINKFHFHGRGCHFQGQGIEIDWDFGDKEHWAGIDPYKLIEYIKTNEISVPGYDKIDLLINDIEQAFQNGKMVKRHGLYYFTNRKRGVKTT